MTVAMWGGLFELSGKIEIQREKQGGIVGITQDWDDEELRKPRKPWYEIWADDWENVIDDFI